MRVIRCFNVVLGLLLIFGAVGCSSGTGSSSSNSSASVAPSISTPPSAQSVTVGDPVTFTVVATGTAPLSYQWYMNNVAISGATADYYSIASAQSANAGNYTVTVSNGTLPNATSTAVALTVNPVVVAPTISTYPASQSVVAGNSASFSVVATGSAPLSYQWHLDNVNDGSNSASYQSPSTTAIGSHTVTVTVSNAAGSVLSNPALLTVTAMPVAPSISTPPSAQSVTVGDPVTFTVVATGTAPLSYQWYMNNVAISGATADYYSIASAQSANTGNYTVTVSNGTLPNATSTAVALTVNPVVVAPTISTYPASQSVVAGNSASFSVVATGSAPLSYQWHLDNVNDGSNSASYQSPSTTAIGSHTVTVTVSNAAGSVLSNPALLTVTAMPVAPSISTPPSAQSVTVGDPVTFTVVATGTAPLSYQWYMNNVAISGATADYYSIASAQSANAGNYTVTVSNGTLPNATSTAVALTVNPVVVAPTISTYPASQSVVAGNSASFSVVATGSAPLSYQWHLDNVNDGSNSASYQSPSTTAIGSHTVTVTVSNAAGSVLSNPALLTVTAMPVAPSISTPPSAQSVTVGNPVTFTVAARGTAPLSYQWYSGTSSTTVTTPISGANSDFYAPSTALAGTTYYAVTISNGTGTPATSTAVALTVNAAPVAPTTAISGSSTPSVTEGQSITFTATATGSTPYTYLWQQNGTSVGSNASTFTLALPRLADSGSSITVTVTNAAGSVTSSAVTLTVNPLLVNLGGSMPLNLTPIPAGTFTMGSPSSDPDHQPNETQHQVTISQNFYMGTYLVTQAQWTQVMSSKPQLLPERGGSPRRPATPGGAGQLHGHHDRSHRLPG